MFTLTRAVIERFQSWDLAAKIAVIIGVVMLVILIVIASNVAPEQRTYAVVSIFVLLVVLQAIFLWANRNMTTEYTQAQRAYLDGDLTRARDLLLKALEDRRLKGRYAVNVYTLLGNVYRQLGELDRSEQALRQSIQMAPRYHFSLYGFGRTLLVKGDYQQAAVLIRQAMDVGAPAVVKADYAEALLRQGAARDTVIDALRDALPAAQSEPHRALLVTYMLHTLGESEPPSAELVGAGIEFWQSSAERFAHTPYGVALRDDVERMQSMM